LTKGKRVLVVAPRAPDYDRGSGSQRVFDFVDFLQDAGWSVTFAAGGWCLKSVPPRIRLDERYADVLQQRGIPTYAGLNDRTRAMIAESRFDLAVLAYFHVAESWMPSIRSLSPSTRIIVDNLDLNFVRTARQRFQQRERLGEIGMLDAEYGTEMIRELNVYAAADVVLAVSQKEADLVNDLTAEPTLTYTVPDGDELEASTIPFGERKGILFLGTFLHPPNLDAATYLCTMILPQLDPHLTIEHPVSLVGDGLDRVERGFQPMDVRMVGWVPSVVPYLERARVTVMPLPYGAGTKRKVIHSLMVGTPAVATAMAAEGLDLRDGEHFLLAEDPVTFARSITRLLQDEELWHRLCRQGREHMRAARSRETTRQRFLGAVDLALGRQPKSSDRARCLELHRPGMNRPELVQRVRRAVRACVPRSATVLVVSRGDDDLLNLDGRRAWHFLRSNDSNWAGRNPLHGTEAVRQLEDLRAEGADFLLIPSPAFWWLEYYKTFAEYLKANCRMVACHKDDCMIFSLHEAPVPADRPAVDGRALDALVAWADGHAQGEPSTVSGLEPINVLRRRTSQQVAPPRLESEATLAPLLDRSAPTRTLVVGSYLADEASRISQIVSTLAKQGPGGKLASRSDATQRWIAMGAAPPSRDVQEVTVRTLRERRPKYELVNELLACEDLSTYDYVLVLDDDIILPSGFLDSFLAVQQHLGFVLAQPALTTDSPFNLPIVEQQCGVLGRQTLLVQAGPIVSFHRSIFDLVFPFDLTSPTGMGYERVWAYLLHERKLKMGIIDAVSVAHCSRNSEPQSDLELARLRCSAYLRGHRHYSLDSCMRVLEVYTSDQLQA